MPWSIIEEGHDRTSRQELEVEAMEDTACQLAHRLMLSYLSNTAQDHLPINVLPTAGSSPTTKIVTHIYSHSPI